MCVRARICVCIAVSFDAEQILSFVEYTQSFLVLYSPTHHTRSSSTLLDICIIDDQDKLIAHEQHDVFSLDAWLN